MLTSSLEARKVKKLRLGFPFFLATYMTMGDRSSRNMLVLSYQDTGMSEIGPV